MVIRYSGLWDGFYLTQYQYILVHMRSAFFFYTAALNKLRNPRILFVGEKQFNIGSDILVLLNKKLLVKNIYGIDSWFNGFLTIERKKRTFDRFFHRFKYLAISSYTRLSNKSTRKLNEILSILRYPSFIFFFKTSGSSFFAEYEIYKKLIPSIAFISPESKNYGFSGMTFSVPFPYTPKDKFMGLWDFYNLCLRYTEYLILRNIFMEKTKLVLYRKTRDRFVPLGINTLAIKKQAYPLILPFLASINKIKKKILNDIFSIHSKVRTLLDQICFYYNNVNLLRLFKEKTQFFNKMKNIVNHNINYISHILVGFFFYVIWKAGGLSISDERQLFLFRDKHIFYALDRIFGMLKSFKIQFFQYMPYAFKRNKWFSYFSNIKEKNSDPKNFVFGFDFLKKMRYSSFFKEENNKIPMFFSTRRVQTLNSVLLNNELIPKLNKNKYKKK